MTLGSHPTATPHAAAVAVQKEFESGSGREKAPGLSPLRAGKPPRSSLHSIGGSSGIYVLESLELALLIQNKGKGPLDVKIIAPSFVSLEKQQIHLVENKHERLYLEKRNLVGVVTDSGKGHQNIYFYRGGSHPTATPHAAAVAVQKEFESGSGREKAPG
ncbi:hypothetical protein AgCh_005974 [Apium graveolens]